MAKKARLGLYLADEEIKRQIKVAAAKRGMTATDYCAQAIEERLDGSAGDGVDQFGNRHGALLLAVFTQPSQLLDYSGVDLLVLHDIEHQQLR